jgi:hypothetical protein
MEETEKSMQARMKGETDDWRKELVKEMQNGMKTGK